MILFTDSSASPQNNLGVGGYLLVPETELSRTTRDGFHEVHLKLFEGEGVSSTKLELRTMIWALGCIQPNLDAEKLTVYTDSQNVAGLIGRRARLEQKSYRNRFGEVMKQAEKYQTLFALLDDLNQQSTVEILKIKGHQRKYKRTELEKLFSLVDQATRRRLRNLLSENGVL